MTYGLSCVNGGSTPVYAQATVTVTPPPPTVSLTASPTTLNADGSTTLSWTVTNATSCTAGGSWSGSKAAAGGSQSVNVGPTVGSRTYSLTCVNGAGGPSASDSVNVAVNAAVPTVTLNADDATLIEGQPVTLTWSSTNATRCVASVQWTGNKATSGSEGSVMPSTSGPGNRSYRLTCFNGPGAGAPSGSATVVVNYAPIPTPTVDVSIDPVIVGGSQPYTVRWTSTNATSCTASGSWSGSRATSGQQGYTMPFFVTQRTYTLTCENGPGGPTATDTAIAGLQAPGVNIDLVPTEVRVGSPTTVTWSSTNADSCTASQSWSGNKAASGSETGGPFATAGNYPFRLVCTNAAGPTTRIANLSVVNSLPPTVTLNANPSSIFVGESARLSCVSTNATSCSRSGYWSSQAVATSGSAFSSPPGAGTYSYTVTCTNSDGSRSDTAAVQVNAPAGVTATLSERNNQYTAQATVDTRYLVWSSSNANNCVLRSPDGTAIATTLTRSAPGLAVGPFGAHRVETPQPYTLTCTDGATDAVSQVTFTVTSAPAPTPTPAPAAVGLALNANPTNFQAGGSTTVTWTGTNVAVCVPSGRGAWTATADSNGNLPSSGSRTIQIMAAGNTPVGLTCYRNSNRTGDSIYREVPITTTAAPTPTPTPAPAPSCGTAHNTNPPVSSPPWSSGQPHGTLCGAGWGSHAGTTTATRYEWQCGPSGGHASNVGCFRNRALPGACGSAHATTTSSHPSSASGVACAAGSSYDDRTDTSTEWRWACESNTGGTTASCYANKVQNCAGGTVSWRHNNSSTGLQCSGNRPERAPASAQVTIDDTTGSERGFARYSCNASGSWVMNGPPECLPFTEVPIVHSSGPDGMQVLCNMVGGDNTGVLWVEYLSNRRWQLYTVCSGSTILLWGSTYHGNTAAISLAGDWLPPGNNVGDYEIRFDGPTIHECSGCYVENGATGWLSLAGNRRFRLDVRGGPGADGVLTFQPRIRRIGSPSSERAGSIYLDIKHGGCRNGSC